MKDRTEDSVTICVRLPMSLRKALRNASEKTRVGQSEIFRAAVRYALGNDDPWLDLLRAQINSGAADVGEEPIQAGRRTNLPRRENQSLLRTALGER